MTEQLKLHWDWNPQFCVPPFEVLWSHKGYVTVKAYGSKAGKSGWNVLYTLGPLPEGTEELKALKNSMLQMVELRYLQETVDAEQTYE